MDRSHKLDNEKLIIRIYEVCIKKKEANVMFLTGIS